MTGKAAAAVRKGRPRKKRKGRTPRQTDPPRRALRPRPRRLVHDDFLTDEEEEEEEERKRRGRKKLRLVLKLPHIPARGQAQCPDSRSPSRSSSAASSESYVDDDDAASDNDDEEEEEEEERTKPLKKRRLGGGRGGALASPGSGPLEEREANGVQRSTRSASGVLPTSPRTTLPERKTLEGILDKLQKKDYYGVFAQPVDPDELPDYHDVIEHPMDFSTVRKKLANGVYHSFEQFEDDVFLICSNAMQYNAPDTIYFRQAHSIQEMARKKFQSLRTDHEHDAAEKKSEEKIRSSSIEKKPIKKSLCLTSHEPVVSDISSIATLASAGDTCTVLNTAQASVVERPVNVYGSVEGSSSPGESKSEKADEISAKGSPSKVGRKPFVADENRRTTYSAADQQQFDECDLMFDVFKGEMKQLIAVGLNAEYSYARSLARFAGHLGPIAWRIASERIEKTLPAGVKFGPGWVGEFEPLPTPILSFENHTQQRLGNSSNLQRAIMLSKDKVDEYGTKAGRNIDSKNTPVSMRHRIIGSSNKTSNRAKERRTTEAKHGPSVTTETRAGVSNVIQRQHQERLIVDFAMPYTNNAEQVRPCTLPSIDRVQPEAVLKRQGPSSEFASSRSREMISMNRKNRKPESPRQRESMNSRNRNCQQSESKRQPEAVESQVGNDALRIDGRGLNNGKVTGKSDNNRLNAPLDFITNHRPQAASYLHPVPSQVNAIDNPFRLISSSGKMSNQSSISNIDTYNSKDVMPSVPQPTRENLSAAAAAARAWMSIGATAEHKSVDGIDLFNKGVGAASLFNSSSWKRPNLAFVVHEDSNIRPVSQVSSQPVQVANEESRLQDRGLVIFPQLVGVDLGRFHGQSPLQGLVQHPQHRKDRDMLPPDLNLTFQPTASPLRPSSGIHMDSQQPDLALQL